MNTSQGTLERSLDQQTKVRLIDADVHPYPRSFSEMVPYFDLPWREMPMEALHRPSVLYPFPEGGTRLDAYPESGGPACSDPVVTDQQLLTEAGVDYAILLPLVRLYNHPDFEAALCAATNRWLVDTWLTDYNRHHRYYGSINVCATDPVGAADEINRWADHPAYVQVRVNSYAYAPMGDTRYDPIYAAASDHGLPVAMHFSKGDRTTISTPVGFSASYFEHHCTYAISYATHLASLLARGTFLRFPDLRFVFVEGGFAWVGPLISRMDRLNGRYGSDAWGDGTSAAQLVRDHVRFTTQPLENPRSARELRLAFEHGQASEVLMFASDYPHWDYDDPSFTLRKLPPSDRERVACETALAFYGFPREREATSPGAGE